MATRRGTGPARKSAGTAGPPASDAARPDDDAGGTALSRALANGANTAELFRSVLASAGLTPEQQSVLDLILAMQDGEDGPAGAGRLDDDGAAPIDQPEAIRAMQRELTDLRQVNDTVAAALGACPLCWGGDRGCRACHGLGRTGYAAPDPDLFNQLVVPATERVRMVSRARHSAPARSRW